MESLNRKRKWAPRQSKSTSRKPKTNHQHKSNHKPHSSVPVSPRTTVDSADEEHELFSPSDVEDPGLFSPSDNEEPELFSPSDIEELVQDPTRCGNQPQRVEKDRSPRMGPVAQQRPAPLAHFHKTMSDNKNKKRKTDEGLLHTPPLDENPKLYAAINRNLRAKIRSLRLHLRLAEEYNERIRCNYEELLSRVVHLVPDHATGVAVRTGDHTIVTTIKAWAKTAWEDAEMKVDDGKDVNSELSQDVDSKGCPDADLEGGQDAGFE